MTVIHPGFKSKKIRVNLNLPIKAETKAESTDVLKAVDEDRKYVIQATIVRYVCFGFTWYLPSNSTPGVRRIMKARKTMKNQPLIQEVISQISQRFAPKIPDIKKVSSAGHYGMKISDQFVLSARLSILSWRRSISNVSRAHETPLHTSRNVSRLSRLVSSLSFLVAYCSCSPRCFNVYNRNPFPFPLSRFASLSRLYGNLFYPFL